MDTKSKADAPHHAGRGRVFDSIVDTVGDTPIVRLRRLPQQHGVTRSIWPSSILQPGRERQGSISAPQ